MGVVGQENGFGDGDGLLLLRSLNHVNWMRYLPLSTLINVVKL